MMIAMMIIVMILGDDDNDDQTQVISFLDRSRQHPQAIYSSRLLNPYIKDLGTECSECLDCEIKD